MPIILKKQLNAWAAEQHTKNSWYLPPNLGLYQGPDWVAEHPGFQRGLRERIEAKMWKAEAK